VDYPAFLKAVDRGQVPPVALLHGPGVFLLEGAVQRLTDALFPPPAPGAGPRDLALLKETLDARDVDVDAIVGAALMLPWTSARRLVVAKGVEDVRARPRLRKAAGYGLRTGIIAAPARVTMATSTTGPRWKSRAERKRPKPDG